MGIGDLSEPSLAAGLRFGVVADSQEGVFVNLYTRTVQFLHSSGLIVAPGGCQG
jgi:hypothetical protein